MSGPNNPSPEHPTIGRYRIDWRIGGGGMADIFLATDQDAEEGAPEVVIKVLRPDRASEEHIRMFLDEARICSNINHPAVPELYEVGEVNGLPFLVMEHINGPTLHQIQSQLNSNRFEMLDQLANVMAEVARVAHHAYFYAPEGGEPLKVVHRDVSLSNVLVSQDGQTMLVDFGIAKGSQRFAETMVGTIKGSFEYLAPEQLAGKEIDHRTDIFQIGLCLYRLSVGAEPFAGDSVASLLQARLTSNIRPPSSIYPDFPEELAAILTRALSAEADDRYQTGEELAAALDTFVYNHTGGMLGPENMAGWINTLFPEGPADWRRLKAIEATPTWIGHVSGIQAKDIAPKPAPVITPLPRAAEPAAPPPPRSRPALWIGLSMAAAMLVSVGTVWMLRSDPPPAEPVADTENVNETATLFLDEADRLLEASKSAQASALIEKAAELNPTDPHLGLRLEKLRFSAAQETRLSAGSEALSRGDRDAARTHAEEAISADPSDERAQELWAETMLEPAAPGETAEEKAARKAAAREAAAERAAAAREAARRASARAARQAAREAAEREAAEREAAEREAAEREAAEREEAAAAVAAAETTPWGSSGQPSPTPTTSALTTSTPSAPVEAASTEPTGDAVAALSEEEQPAPEASPEPAPESRARTTAGSGLPDPTAAYVKTTDLSEVRQVLAAAEAEASRKGVPSSYSRGTTASLMKSIERAEASGEPYVLNPNAITEQIVTGYQSGSSRSMVVSQLKRTGGK